MLAWVGPRGAGCGVGGWVRVGATCELLAYLRLHVSYRPPVGQAVSRRQLGVGLVRCSPVAWVVRGCGRGCLSGDRLGLRLLAGDGRGFVGWEQPWGDSTVGGHPWFFAG